MQNGKEMARAKRGYVHFLFFVAKSPLFYYLRVGVSWLGFDIESFSISSANFFPKAKIDDLLDFWAAKKLRKLR